MLELEIHWFRLHQELPDVLSALPHKLLELVLRDNAEQRQHPIVDVVHGNNVGDDDE